MTLVIMAAGLGSRYGIGCKPIEGVGPAGEILLEYAVYDAVAAGFTKFVFIIKDDMRGFMDTLCAGSLSHMKTKEGTPIEIICVYQDFSSLPDFYTIPEGRTKPYGTTHATLCAKDVVNEPFAVINADDYYGPEAFKVIYDVLPTLAPSEGCMVGYRLKNTVSRHGTVNRGICREENGILSEVIETRGIIPDAEGVIRAESESDNPYPLDPDSLVSMNFWGYNHGIFTFMEEYFNDFLRSLAPDDLKSECLLPPMNDDLIKSGRISVKVLQSGDKWFGMTYAADRPIVAEELRQLHEAGVYPETIRINTL